MTILDFARHCPAPRPAPLARLAAAASLEVMPRTLAALPDLVGLRPAGSRIYVAHIDGTPFEDMLSAARRLCAAGYRVMPHLPARSIASHAQLADWVDRYAGEAGVREALVLAGGRATPRGPFDNSMQLLETGLLDRAGLTRLHVAGHPEGNRAIDADGSDRAVMAALRWKQAFSERSDAAMALVTQFVFDAAPLLAWTERLTAEGLDLPVHAGIAGPARLQTLIRYAIACGVGPSLAVLQARARDVTRLVRPFEPTGVAEALAAHIATRPDTALAGLHLFPLGGIAAAADWASRMAGDAAPRARRGAPQ